MPNVIKYSTSPQTLALKKGNFWLGIGDVDKGPTETSGYWNGITPPLSGYTIYINKASNGPSIINTINDTDLINNTNVIANSSYTSTTQCFTYFAGQSDKMVVNKNYPYLNTNGLILNLDPTFIPSYPNSGVTWYDISASGNSATLVNGPTFNGQSFQLDNIDDYIQFNNIDFDNLANTNNFTAIFLCKKEFYGTGGNLIGNSTLFQGSNNGYNNGWRLIEGNNGTPGAPFFGRHYFILSMPQLSWNISYIPDSYDVYRPAFVAVSVGPSTSFGFCNESVVTATTGTYISGSTSGKISFTGAGVGAWGGKIFNSKFYNRALSQNEVRQIYYGGPITLSGLTWYADAGNAVSYESGSTSTYSLIGSYSGSLLNGVSYLNNYGGAWDFDGVDDRIQMNTRINVTTPFSIEYVIQIKRLPTTGQYYYTFSSTSGGYTSNGAYGEFGPGYFALCTLNAPSFAAGVSISNHVINTPYYVSVTYENRVLKGYVNGVLRATTNLTFDPTNNPTDITSFGSLNNIGYYSPITLSFFRYYNRALSDSEVSQNFGAQASRFNL
jgi:hypothetical protein